MLTVSEYRKLLRGLPKDFYLWRDRRPMHRNQRLEVVLSNGTRHTVKLNTFISGMDAAGGREYEDEYLKEDGSVVHEDKIVAYKPLN